MKRRKLLAGIATVSTLPVAAIGTSVPAASAEFGQLLAGSMSGTITDFNFGYSTINFVETLTNTVAGSSINGLTVNHATAAGAGQGNRSAINAVLSHNAATPGSASAGLAFYSAAFATTYVTANDGGTALAPKGDFYGYGGIVTITPAGTHIHGIIGAEFDVSVETGAAVVEKIGLQVCNVNSDVVKGSLVDAAILVSADQNATAKFDYGLVFGKPGYKWNVSGTLIGTYTTSNAMACVNGIDFTAITFTGHAIKSKGFNVDKDGAGQASHWRYEAPWINIKYRDTNLGVTAGGLHRLTSNGAGGYQWQVNTAASGDFSSVNASFSVDAAGVFSVPSLKIGTKQVLASLTTTMPANATDLASALTLLNAMKSVMIANGLAN